MGAASGHHATCGATRKQKLNFYDNLDWNAMLLSYPKTSERAFSVPAYHEILCPADDYPQFLKKYISLPLMQRLSGIGLLCGTDWTPLYKNRFRYSRLDHSIGVALIIWHFTHDKAQTLSGLFHDVSTTVFSHVSDFRKGDALTQTATEEPNAALLQSDEQLLELLREDGLSIEEVKDYHIYPIADNEIPNLSADRLEYMFPSGAALQGSWSLEEVAYVYGKIAVLMNEEGKSELGFTEVEAAEIYTEKFLETGHVLQLNENKLTLQLLAEITNLAIQLGIITEEDCLRLSEKEVIAKFEEASGFAEATNSHNPALHRFSRLFKTFRSMEKIYHTDSPMPDSFCVNLTVKQRFINPLVSVSPMAHAKRISEVSKKSASLIQDFLNWKDTPFGCVQPENFSRKTAFDSLK